MNQTANNNNNNNNGGRKSYAATADRLAAANRASRLERLNLVSNAARKAHPAASTTNEAIALYLGINPRNLRSYRQCINELHLEPAVIHTLPAVDVWGRNSDEYCNAHQEVAKYYPRAAFDCTDILKVDAAADFPPMDDRPTVSLSDCLIVNEKAEEITDSFFATDDLKPVKTKKPRKPRAKKAAAPVTMTADDLPF